MERSNVILNGVLAVAEMISKIEELDKRVKELEKAPQVAGTTSEDKKKIKGIKVELSNHDIQPKDTK